MVGITATGIDPDNKVISPPMLVKGVENLSVRESFFPIAIANEPVQDEFAIHQKCHGFSFSKT
jgi:hypothetical protein